MSRDALGVLLESRQLAAEIRTVPEFCEALAQHASVRNCGTISGMR